MLIIMFAATIAVICIAMMIGAWETGMVGFITVLLYTLSILIIYDSLMSMSIACV